MVEIDTGLHYPLKLHELPKSWSANYVGEVCLDVQSGFACGRHSDNDIGVPHLRPMNVSRNGRLDLQDIKFVPAEYDVKRLSDGDVLFNNTNSPELIGKTAYVSSSGAGLAFSNHMTRLRFPTGILPQFAAYQLHFLWMARYFLHRCVKHVNQASISSGELAKSIPFVVPPTSEQHRIVAKIEELFSELDKGVESLKTAQAQLKVYRQALLKHAFEGKLTAQWRADNPDSLETAGALLERVQHERTQRYQQQLAEWEAGSKLGSKPKAPKSLPSLTSEELAELPELPIAWAYTYLAELGDLGRGKSKHRPRNDPRLFGGHHPFLQTGEVKAAKRVIREYANTYSDFGLQQSKLWPAGTLCITIAANIAETAFLGFDACFPDSVVGFSAFEKLVKPEYVDFFIQGVRTRIEAYAPATAQKNINLETLENLVVPFCGTDEQKEILDILEERFSVADKLDQTIATSLQQAEALRQSILKKAFSGQLVSQDASDEPASVMLARIKAEKSEHLERSKPRKPQAVPVQPVHDVGKVLVFPVRIAGISATDLHAGVLAMAYRLHEQNPKHVAYFGHVKAEKISHLIESQLGIDLERTPFKDAAGPNDYPHLKKVESRARKANWFDVRQKAGGAYVFSRKSGFDALLNKTANALGERLSEVDALLEVLLPLNTRQAEIVATLYAAWNNLLLTGKAAGDEEIVHEARENWHAAKLDIEREKFFRGLEWMRKRGLVPLGRGRYVGEKGKPSKTDRVKA